MTSYLLIAHEDSTFVVGVYKTQIDAERAFVQILGQQRNYNILQHLYKEEFDALLDRNKLQSLIFGRDDLDKADWFADTLHMSILEAGNGSLFDFTGYTTWDERNLYRALKMVLKSQTGDVERPYATVDLFLRNL